MELRHLRYFVAVAEEGHITRAAARLGIQQPPLSQQIHALERELEVPLFRRKPRGVELTAAGRALLDDARAILAQVEHARAATRRTARGEQGRIVVGFTSSAPFVPFVPQVIRAFRELYPRIALVLEETGTGEMVEALRHELIDATFVLYRRPVGPGLYDAIIVACHGAGFSPLVGQEAPCILSTLSLVAAGLGVSLVPASLQRLHMDGVVFRRLTEEPRPRAPLNLAYRRSESSPAVRSFIAL